MRLFLALTLAALFFFTYYGKQDFSFTSLTPYPIRCHPAADANVLNLVKLSQELGYPGLQISIRNSTGNWIDCASGWADWRGFGEEMNNNHRLRYLSLSKLLVSITAVKMHTLGKVNLDQNLSKTIKPNMDFEDERIKHITLRHLLNHTAGFDRNVSGDPMMSPRPWCPRNINELTRLRLDTPPGEKFSYSNLGYCLLGRALEEVSQEPLEDIIRKELINPADSGNILPIYSVKEYSDYVAIKIDQSETIGTPDHLDYEALLASGGWAGNAASYGRMIEKAFFSNEPLLNDEGQRLLTDTASNCDTEKWRHCHGLGFYQYEKAGGNSMYWRDGSLPGGTTFFAMNNTGVIVVWLANGRNINWITDNDRIGITIYNTLLNTK